MAPEDNAEREEGVLAAKQSAVPTQTSVAVPTTAPTTGAYGFTSVQAQDIITTLNALVVDVTAILTLLGLEHTAAIAT